MPTRSGLLVAVAALAIAAAAPARAAVPRNVSPWAAGARSLGEESEQRSVRITLFLSLRDTAGLKALVAAQSNPRSPQYGKYLTPEQFHAAYAPPAADVARVRDTLTSMGFTIEHIPASGLFVTASGTVGQVKQAFGVTQRLYAYKGQTLRANAETPKLPDAIAKIVVHVAGLDDSARLMHHEHVTIDAPSAAAPVADGASPDAPPPPASGTISPFCSTYWGDHTATLSTAPAPFPATLPWLLCGYTPQQVRQAYGVDKVTQDGTGVRVGIVDNFASPTIVRDANKYAKKFGLPELTYLNFQQIVPPGIYKVPANAPGGPQGWYGEETLDVEAVHSMAPMASIVYAGNSPDDPGNTALYNLIDGHLADIVTNSYSYGGENVPASFIQAENQYFVQAAAEGMSVLFSAGDGGDLAAANGIATGTWDATDSYVTAVGGTSLALYDATGSKAEWGWGDYRAFLNAVTVSADGTAVSTTGYTPPLGFYAGSGGGVSLAMLAPDYQVNVPYALSGYTHLASGKLVPLGAQHRVTPDISMVGDPYTGFTVGETYIKTGNPITDAPCKSISETEEYCLTTIGGTSLSSPLFAGVLALVNQARFAAGKPAVGFVNPALYALPVGAPGTATAPIIDTAAPKTPTAVLRGYLGNLNELRLVTMNSSLNKAGTKLKEGTDTSLTTKPGYDDVTGLGTPNVPALISALQ
jgi:subtilase family serine protease